MKNTVVEAPNGGRGMVMESRDTFAMILMEDGTEAVFDKSFLNPVKAVCSGLPVARVGNDKLTKVLSRIRDANVGHDDFYGDVVIPYKKIQEIIMNELRLSQMTKPA